MARIPDYSNPQKYSKRQSFDGQPVEPGKVLVPFRKDLYDLQPGMYIQANFTTMRLGEFRYEIGFMPIREECFQSYMIDFLMNRQRQSVQFMIFSKKWEEIANAIATKLDHGVTILDGHGWYTGHDRKVLCILAKKRESQIIFRIIKSIDPQAFVSQSAVIGVFGEGFDQIKVKGIEN